MTGKICLVTGGAGFIGCALSSLLPEHFDRVVVLDNLHPQVHPTSNRPVALDSRVEFVLGDVTDAKAWDQLLADIAPDTIIHLAAETGTGQSLTEATRHARVNVVGTTEMLDALVRHDRLPRQILLTSSRAVYGEGAWIDRSNGLVSYPGQRSRVQLENHVWDFPGLEPLPFNSAITEPRPTSVYGATKLTQEQILCAWALAVGVKPILLRLQNVYGEGQSLINPYTGIVSLFARLAREGKSIPVYEDGLIVRDFVHITDVVSAILAAMLRGEAATQAYDVGYGTATTIQELADIVAAHYGAPAPHITKAFRHGDVRHASCDIVRTKTELSWTPLVNVEKGISRLCAWIEQELI
jgi:dTDP-L-rhamnose 4-epimerase